MSFFGFAGSAASKYKSLFNLRSAKNMTRMGWRTGGFRSAAVGAGRWAWGKNISQRATRIGTLGAAALLGRSALSGLGWAGGNIYQLGRTPYNILQRGDQPGPF